MTTSAPFDLGAAWEAAVELLSAQELAVLEMRLRTGSAGEPMGFVAIARELGISRRQARELHEGAVARLGARQDTEELAGLFERIGLGTATRRPEVGERQVPKASPPILEHVESEPTPRAAAEPEIEVGEALDPVASRDERVQADLEPASDWRVALGVLTEREGAVLSLRHGAFGSDHLTFADVAQRLGISRQRAHQLHHRAITVLMSRAETRTLAGKLGASVETEAEDAPLDEATGADQVLPQEPAAQRSPISSSSGTEQPEGAVAAPQDSAPSKRDYANALARVNQADRELTTAVELCRVPGHEALVEALESARSILRVHMREAASSMRGPKPAPSATQVLPPRSAPSPEAVPAGRRGPGRPENVAETARRAAALARVQSGELSNAEAASALGIKVSAWAGWKAHYLKRNAGSIVAPHRPAVEFDVPRPDVEKLVARIQELERFGRQLRERMRTLVKFVAEWVPS